MDADRTTTRVGPRAGRYRSPVKRIEALNGIGHAAVSVNSCVTASVGGTICGADDPSLGQATTRRVARVGSSAYAMRLPAAAWRCNVSSSWGVMRSPGARMGTPGG
jgi:hypothetical protein